MRGSRNASRRILYTNQNFDSDMPGKRTLVITCEHASNAVPAFAKSVFAGCKDLLGTHRGYDIGALCVYRHLCKDLRPDYSCAGKYSRLAIDLNRSLNHPNVLSEYSEKLPEAVKEKLRGIWRAHRSHVEEFIGKALRKGAGNQVLHLGIHSFTPVMNGTPRNADIGILYDPARPAEKETARALKKKFNEKYPEFKIRFNYPYRGAADGFTTALRKKFGTRYIGLEIEISQALLTK